MQNHASHSDTQSLLETFAKIPLELHDTTTYNLLISHFLLQDLPHHALTYYEQLKQLTHLAPDKATYALLIKAYSESSDFANVDFVFREMNKHNIGHCKEMYWCVLKSHLLNDDLEGVDRLELLMKENALVCSTQHINR